MQKEELLQDRYKILECIGIGGTSKVYRVEDVRLGKKWAMKCINTKNKDLMMEAVILKKMKHTGIPLIVDVFMEKNQYCMVMECVEGITLEEWIQKNGKADEKMGIECLFQLASILSYLHNRRPPILYLDMKPQNIMITKQGELKLIDFGAAISYVGDTGEKMTEQKRYGTIGYASEEQLQLGKKELDAGSDIYSLGITMYYLLTGISPQKPPYVIGKIREENPAISTEMEKIIQKMIQKERVKRFFDCEEILAGIKKLVQKNEREEIRKGILLFFYYGSFFITAVLAGMGIEGLQIEGWKDYKKYLGVSVFIFALTYLLKRVFLQNKKKKIPYLTKCNLLITEKMELGLWCLLMITTIVLSHSAISKNVEEGNFFSVKDMEMRKIVIKENSIYYTKTPIRFECEEGENAFYQVSVKGSKWSEIKNQSFLLNINKLKQEKEALEIIFRERRPKEERVSVQTFRIAYG